MQAEVSSLTHVLQVPIKDANGNLTMTLIQINKIWAILHNILTVHFSKNTFYTRCGYVGIWSKEHSCHAKDVIRSLLAHTLRPLRAVLLSDIVQRVVRNFYLINPDVYHLIIVVKEVKVLDRHLFTNFLRLWQKDWLMVFVVEEFYWAIRQGSSIYT